MFLHRHSTVEQLTPLLKSAEGAEVEIGNLATVMPDIPSKTQFIRYWQRHAECVVDLEEKIRVHGGAIEQPVPPRVLGLPIDAGSRVNLVAAAQVEEDLIQTYRHALRGNLPVDVRMMLERHILFFQEVLRHSKAPTVNAPADVGLTA